jgi:hypothetical protein
MPRCLKVAIVPPSVRYQYSLYPTPKLGISVGSNHEVEVVRRQAIAQNVHDQAGMSIDHALEKGIIVRWFMEDGFSAISPI